MENSSSQPTTPPSSSSKCHEEEVVEKDGVDRISDLPDYLLCLILSFLPTLKAVETSILSSRWKTLWTFVPSLDLDIDYRDWEVIASKVFALHKAPYVKFHLSLISPYNPSHVGTRVKAAISPNLEDFSLSIYNSGTGNDFYRGELFVLPRSIFSCKNLVVLELTGPIILNLNPSSVWFPRLKVLRLNLITYNESDWSLLSGCPVLEDLCLGRTGFLIKDKEDLEKQVKFKICVPTLKRLTMFVSLSSDHLDYEFEINALALEYFHIEGELGNVVFLEKPSNLVEATVDISPYENYFEENPDYEERVLGLLRQLDNVKKLKLSSDTTEWLHCSHDNYNLPMFHKLVRLDFEVECCNWGLLPHFLDQAPNLEVLDFDMFPCSSNSRNLGCPNSRQVEPPDVPRSFSGLTTFCFRHFEGLKDQLKVARYILKNARDLKTMTLTGTCILQNPKDEKSCILEKLSTFPKLSMSCQIAFD